MGIKPDLSSQGLRALCRDWGLGEPIAQENEPVSSDVPTLLMSGSLDPVTPPHYMSLAAEKLTRAHLYEMPNYSHVPSMRHLCAVNLVRAFFQDPDHPQAIVCGKDLRLW